MFRKAGSKQWNQENRKLVAALWKETGFYGLLRTQEKQWEGAGRKKEQG